MALDKKKIGLAAAAALLAGGMGIQGAMAYFTTYATAGGEVAITLAPPETHTDEKFDSWTKHITVTNTGEVDCYVRVRAYSGSGYELTYSNASGDWTDDQTDERINHWHYGSGDEDGGWWYYTKILSPGETIGGEDGEENATEILDIQIGNVPEGEVTDPSQFHVAVVQECTPVQYDEDGNPYADWTLEATVEATGLADSE